MFVESTRASRSESTYTDWVQCDSHKSVRCIWRRLSFAIGTSALSNIFERDRGTKQMYVRNRESNVTAKLVTQSSKKVCLQKMLADVLLVRIRRSCNFPRLMFDFDQTSPSLSAERIKDNGVTQRTEGASCWYCQDDVFAITFHDWFDLWASTITSRNYIDNYGSWNRGQCHWNIVADDTSLFVRCTHHATGTERASWQRILVYLPKCAVNFTPWQRVRFRNNVTM